MDTHDATNQHYVYRGKTHTAEKPIQRKNPYRGKTHNKVLIDLKLSGLQHMPIR